MIQTSTIARKRESAEYIDETTKFLLGAQDQPMDIAVSTTSEAWPRAAFVPSDPGRIEKMTSLMTCEMRPCWASTAIFVLSFTLFASWLSSRFFSSFSFPCARGDEYVYEHPEQLSHHTL